MVDADGEVTKVVSVYNQLEFIACSAWVIGWLVAWTFVAVWVTRDAEKRGKSGLLWFLVVFILGLLGLIIYLLVRDDRPAYPPYGYPPYQQYGYPPYQQYPQQYGQPPYQQYPQQYGYQQPPQQYGYQDSSRTKEPREYPPLL